MSCLSISDVTECEICDGIDELGTIEVPTQSGYSIHLYESCVQLTLEKLHIEAPGSGESPSGEADESDDYVHAGINV